MKIRCLYILIGCVAALNISAQDISKPVIKKTEVQTPKRTTKVESNNRTSVKKDKTVNRVAPQRNNSYSSNFNSYKQQLSAEEMYEKGDEYYNKKDYAEAVKWYCKSAEQGNSNAQTDLGWMYCNGY